MKQGQLAKQRQLEKKLTQTISVRRDEQQPEKVEVIAAAILEIAKSTRAMLSAGLKKETLVTLIHDQAVGVGKPAIRETLRVCAILDDLTLTRR